MSQRTDGVDGNVSWPVMGDTGGAAVVSCDGWV
jgi:hypothetical protein